MLEAIALVRIFLMLAGIASVILAIKLMKPPLRILLLAIKFCWIAGVLNFAVDLMQKHFGLWHYTVPGLIIGYPLDLYISVSIFLGVTLCLIYWWVSNHHPSWTLCFLVISPFYFFLQDYAVISVTGNSIISLDSPLWWLVDFFSVGVILFGTFFVFDCISRSRPGSSTGLVKTGAGHASAVLPAPSGLSNRAIPSSRVR